MSAIILSLVGLVPFSNLKIFFMFLIILSFGLFYVSSLKRFLMLLIMLSFKSFLCHEQIFFLWAWKYIDLLIVCFRCLLFSLFFSFQYNSNLKGRSLSLKFSLRFLPKHFAYSIAPSLY